MPDTPSLSMQDVQQLLGEYVVALYLARKRAEALEAEVQALRMPTLVKAPSRGEDVGQR